MRIGIIVGSTRPGRRGDQIGAWIYERAGRWAQGTDLEFELIDLLAYNLPILDEPAPAAFGQYTQPHTRRWAAKVNSLDGFIFVVPEYNHSYPAAVKNAVDFLFTEWNDKAAAFVSYGTTGGGRAVEHLRLVLAEVKVATVRSQVLLSIFEDFDLENPTQVGKFAPRDQHSAVLERMLGELASWAGALQAVRADTPAWTS
jgi:NAD(P)H-dependent FMN reductase